MELEAAARQAAEATIPVHLRTAVLLTTVEVQAAVHIQVVAIQAAVEAHVAQAVAVILPEADDK